MKVIKPLTLGFLSRPFTAGGRHRLGVSVFAFVPIAAAPRLYAEQDMWRLAPRVLGATPVIDEGIPKSRAEVLVAGRAFPPERPATTCPVEVELGDLKKELHVVGERFWVDGVPTEPIPFEAMDVSWENAFGGPGHAPNPRGKGVAPIEREGASVHPLPSVEQPSALVRSPAEKPPPAGFRALDVTNPIRSAHRGTYDMGWLEKRFPSAPEDEDWRVWNLAPADQQREQPFVGDEAIRVVNMHPERAVLEGQLPGLRGRCFVVKGDIQRIDNKKRPEGELTEVPLRLMTVWLWPEHDRAVLVFSGHVDVHEDDARDVSMLVLAAERIGEERPLAHYDAVVDRRFDPEWGALQALFDDDLVPADLPASMPLVDPELSPEWLLRKNAQRGARREWERGRALAEDNDLTLEELGIPEAAPDIDQETPELREIPERVRMLRAQMKEQEAAAEEKRREALEEAERLCEQHDVDFDELRVSFEREHVGPPGFKAEHQRELLRAKAEEAAALEMPTDWLEEQIADEEVFARWQEHEAQLLGLYRIGAHHQKPFPPVDAEVSRDARERVLAALRDGESLARRDLTGIDLRGADLRGADLTEALMESVRLNGANLDGARLDGAVLAHADLTDASLRAASLREANLGKALLCRTRTSEGTDLSGAVLFETRGDGAELVGANLSGANLIRASLRGADLSGASLRGAQLIEADLSGARLVGADLHQVAFLEMDLSGVDFSDARASEASFVTVKLERAVFARADLSGARFVAGCSMRGVDLRHAVIPKSSLRFNDLREADLSGAVLHGADLSEADLRDATLYRVAARQALFVRADLRGAVLMGADLLGAMLAKADLRGADLRGANLYGVDFALVRGDDKTQLDEANRNRWKVHPRRREA